MYDGFDITCQGAIAQVQFGDISEVSNVQRQGEACVRTQANVDAVYSHLDDGKRQHSCFEDVLWKI